MHEPRYLSAEHCRVLSNCLAWLPGGSLPPSHEAHCRLQELCDLEPFLERSVDGLPPCKTCFFPTYPHINNINVSDYKPMDMSHQWFFFHGDSTLRQYWGEFFSFIHKTQVRVTLQFM